MHLRSAITDPKVLTRPFAIRLPFEKRARETNYELLEAACVEGEKGVEGLGFADSSKR